LHHFKIQFLIKCTHNLIGIKINNKINKLITLIKRTLISIHIGSAEFGPLSVRFGCLRMSCTHKHISRSNVWQKSNKSRVIIIKAQVVRRPPAP
jgi:hypothetical protein